MALIRFTEFSPRFGQEQHVSRATADALCVSGLATLVNETLQERLAHAPAQPSSGSVVPPFATTPTWSVIASVHSPTILIQLKRGHETFFFDSRPAPTWNCPAEIVREFEARLGREANGREQERLDRVTAQGR